MRYNPSIRNILFVCYNITLVNYLKRLLSEKHLPLGYDGVEVLHFFELCGKITGDDIAYEKADTEYYDLVIQDTLEKLPGCPLKYDAVLVDEGQDFSDDMLKIVMSLLNPATNHFTIALDENQNIYRQRRNWKELGIQARGRVHKVEWIYRNTQEIADLARAIVGDGHDPSTESAGSQKMLFPETFEAAHGESPEIRAFPDYAEIFAWVAERITALNGQDGYALSEIAVIYTMKSPDDGSDMNLPRLLEKALDKKGIIHNWMSEDYRAKRSYDITTNSVTISTIHSVKGFDYACVLLLGMDWMEPGRWTEEQIEKLAYVAVTRARERLFIPYVAGNHLIRKIIKWKEGLK